MNPMSFQNTWVPRRGDLGPKTIDQIHKEAELEEHREQIKVQQQLLSKKDTGGRGGGGGRPGPHPAGSRISVPQDEGWNTVPITTKNRPIDTSRLSKITKPAALDFNNELLAPGGTSTWASWGKSSSGDSGSKPSGEAVCRESEAVRFLSAETQSTATARNTALFIGMNTWVPRRGDLGPKTIDQIHKEEEHREQIKVQQQLLSKKDTGGRGGGGGRPGPHPAGSRIGVPQDEGWNTVPITTKNRPIYTSRLSKITKPAALDFNNELLAPGGTSTWASWGKGSSGGSGSKPSGEAAPESGRPATSTLNRFSALQQSAPSASAPSTADSDRRVPQRSSSSRERSDRRGRRRSGAGRGTAAY